MTAISTLTTHELHVIFGICAAGVVAFICALCIHANCIKQSEVDPTGRGDGP